MFLIPYATREFFRRTLFPYVNVGIVVINILVFIFEIYLFAAGGDQAIESFVDTFAAVPNTITDSTPLEPGLITAIFLHSGLIHIAGNMIYLLPFGDNVEDRLGHFRYLIFYLLCGIAATLGFAFLNPYSSDPLIGASGAIAGVLGGYLVLYPKGTVRGILFLIIIFMRVEISALVFIGYWFLLQIFSTLTPVADTASEGSNVAYSAHIIGFATGVLLMVMMLPFLPKRHQEKAE